MRLNGFDFLSSSPHSFIFQRRANRTNFGGILSLLYLLVFLIISSFYLVSYFNEDNYSIQYLYHEKFITEEAILKMVKSDRYNPKLNFCLDLKVDAHKKVADRFQIRRYNNILYSEVNRTTCQQFRVTDLNWLVVYDCLNESTTECKIDPRTLYSNTISINMDYNGFFLLHQNKTSPIYRNKEAVSHRYTPYFKINNPSRLVQTWKIVRYKEQKGFFSLFRKEEDNDYIGLGMKSYDYSEMTSKDGTKDIFISAYDVRSRTFHEYKVLGRVKFDVDYHHYDEYKRTPKSFWDTVANICSLSMTIFNGLCFYLVNYFSNNIDNYKIMEKILYNSDLKPEKKEINNKEINAPNYDLNKSENLIDNSNGDKNLLSINDEMVYENNQELINKDFIEDKENFPKLTFFDFLFNEIYNGRCGKVEIRKLIQKCNEIVSKYYSIECVIYNLIKLENLLKDYRWNNPELNNFDNNESILELKNLISSFNNRIIAFD